MTSETIKLNLIPGGELPVLHSSQFDTGRALIFEIYDGEELFTSFDAYDISLHARKVDGTIIGIDTYNVDSENHQVIFFTTEQLTACAGKNICELVFTDSISGSVVGSCNFWLEVEGDPYSGGIDSASDIENLSTQIAAIVDSQLDNYYTKEEIDDQIETIVTEQVTPIVSGIVSEQVPPAVQAELGNYYTKSETDSAFYDKSEVDSLLSGKADTSDLPDMTNYYDKSTTDTLLASKANTSTTYTKTEVDNLIAAIPSNDITTEIDTQASIMSFNDGGNDIPLKSCLCEIPVDGDGISTVTITRAGKNFCPILSSQTVNGVQMVASADGTLTFNRESASSTVADFEIPIILPSGEYTISANNNMAFSGDVLSNTFFRPYDANGTSISVQNFNAVNKTYTFTNSVSKIVIRIARTFSESNFTLKMQLEQGDTSTAYETYKGHNTTVSLGETLTQGGTLEAVSGLLTRTDETTSQLTGVNIDTLSGLNNIYTDVGDIQSVEYFNDKADDIAAMISLMTRS